MEGMSSIGQSDWSHFGPDERFLINQLANGAEPEKGLQEIIDREGTVSPAGQYAQLLLDVMPKTIQEIQPIEEREVLPVLIAARNEEMTLPQTLKFLMYSAIDFRKVHSGFHVAIVVSNNVSTDETTAAVARVYHEYEKELVSNHISIEVIYEGNPGKTNGIKKGIKHIKERFAGKYTHVLFSDAEVDWNKVAISALWEMAHPSTGIRPLLVGSNVTPRNRKTLWGFLEHVFYYGYGSLPPRNQGVFLKIVLGMGYLADKSVLYHLEDLPGENGAEDTVLSAFVGPENIAIAADAIVRYDLSEDWNDFKRIQGRHMRETLRTERWLSIKYGEEKGLGMVFSVITNNLSPITDGFLKPTAPLEPLNGSLYKNAGKIIKHIKSVPFLNHQFMDAFVILLFMPFIYSYLTYTGIRQLYNVSWLIALIGLGKRASAKSYVTFLQNMESKMEGKAQVTSNIQNIIWNPVLHRKSTKTVQYKGSPVRKFLSNNLNWAYATVLIIEAFILEFVFKQVFLVTSETLSVIAINITAITDTKTAFASAVLTKTYINRMSVLFDTLSKTSSFIGQHIPISFIMLCLFIYTCLFVFYVLRSKKNKKNFGGKLVDSLKSTSKDFLNIVALPFIALEKIVLYFVATSLIFTRLIFKKHP